MKTILVTGANGFVGDHLVHELTSNNITVIALTGPSGLGQPTVAHVQYQAIDLLDRAAVNQLDFSQIDGIIHLAGLAAVGASYDEPLRYIETNMGIEINLFEAAKAQRAHPRFLIISSGSLYEPAAALPLNEQSAVLPNSPYAVSKLGQEQLAHYYQLLGFDCVIARPFNHVGPGQNLGFIVPDLTKQVVDVAAGRVETIRVGNLVAKRDYTDVRDIVRAYRLLLETGRAGEVYNVCSGVALSGQQILDSIMQSTGSHGLTRQDPARMRPSDAPEIRGDHSKLTAHTGWEPKLDIKTTINDVIADWRSRAPS